MQSPGETPIDPLSVEGTFNFREVGGYPVGGGGHTRFGVLYRSDALGGLTAAGRDALARLRLARIIDLRSDPEVAAAPSALGALQIETQQFSVLRAAAPTAQGRTRHTLDGLYRLAVERRGDYLVGAIRSLGSAPGPVLVHCTAGKDRTGMVVALALDAVGVEREAIVADYTATERRLAGAWASTMLTRIGGNWELPQDSIREIVTTSPARVMRGLLEYVDSEHGGSAAYLRAHGMSEVELEELRSTLTVRPS